MAKYNDSKSLCNDESLWPFVTFHKGILFGSGTVSIH